MTTLMELLEFDDVDPIKCIYHRPIGSKYVMPHWHDAIEVVYVEKGDPGTMYIEGQKYDLHQGDVYIINTRLIHSFDTVILPNQRVVTLLVSYNWLQHCLPKTIKEKSFELIKAPKKDNQTIAFSQLVELINAIKDSCSHAESEDDRLYQLSLEIQLIRVLVNNFMVNKTVKSEVPEVIPQIIEQFQRDYQKDIQLSTVAKEYNYSYAYFSKFFKKYLGISPKKYLTFLRVQKAAEMVEETDDKFSKIATDTGFPDEKSFYAAFKARYGQTPYEYRQSHSTS
jgi:AraC-type DNA-binding domain-containing proteins